MIHNCYQGDARADNLRMRCSRKPSIKFQTLPAGVADTRFSELRKTYRSLGQHKSKLQEQGTHVTTMQIEMAKVLLETRSVAYVEIENECRQRDVRKQFPRVATTHPKYENVISLRRDCRKLKDLSRKYSGRGHQK